MLGIVNIKIKLVIPGKIGTVLTNGTCMHNITRYRILGMLFFPTCLLNARV